MFRIVAYIEEGTITELINGNITDRHDH